MNCKQGDLAIVVRSSAGNEGKVVRCLELLGEFMWLAPDGSKHVVPAWRVDQKLKNWIGAYSDEMPDDFLRPIRPGEGDDETLSWAGKPEKVAA